MPTSQKSFAVVSRHAFAGAALAAWSLAGSAAAQSPAPARTAAETNLNLQDFDFVTEKLRLNYAGWDTKVTDKTRPKLEALTKRLREEAATAPPERFAEILNEWLGFFGDRHIGCMPIGPSSAKTAGETPTLDWNEASVRAQLDALGTRREELEGIWRIAGDRYRVGVLRTPGTDGDFSAVVLDTKAETWKAGQEKARLTRGADGALRGLYRTGDHSSQQVRAKLIGGGAALELDRFGVWTREFPAPPQGFEIDRVAPSPELFLKPLSKSTMWLRLPDFNTDRIEPLKELLASHANELASFPNLLIDLRDNGGGSDYTYQPIIDLLYTRPIYTVGVEFRATEDNVALHRITADALRASQPELAESFDRVVARLAANIGNYVQVHDKPYSIDRRDKVLPLPKRVAILIDGAASSGEQFLLEARQSRKVTLFGQRNSAGILDFANVVEMGTPSGRWKMFWATSRSLRLPDEPVDPDGIAPDIRIDRKSTRLNSSHSSVSRMPSSA